MLGTPILQFLLRRGRFGCGDSSGPIGLVVGRDGARAGQGGGGCGQDYQWGDHLVMLTSYGDQGQL